MLCYCVVLDYLVMGMERKRGRNAKNGHSSFCLLLMFGIALLPSVDVLHQKNVDFFF